MVNGTIGYIKNGYSSWTEFPYYLHIKPNIVNTYIADFTTDENSTYESVKMDKNMILTGNKCIDFKSEYTINRNRRTRGMAPKEFEYGYAITAHKSQGSQWEKVLVVEERFPFDKTEHARWLYTACTRASDKLVLIRS